MAEEHGCEAAEGHRLCSNNCGFFGSLATTNLCSKCYTDLRMKEEQGAVAKAALDANNAAKSSPVYAAEAKSLPESRSAAAEKADPAVQEVESGGAQRNRKRCESCRKRVGLTGFKCRCGAVYCGAHRYPEKHGCGFDYKAAGKEAIQKANPVVKASKLYKI